MELAEKLDLERSKFSVAFKTLQRVKEEKNNASVRNSNLQKKDHDTQKENDSLISKVFNYLKNLKKLKELLEQKTKNKKL